MPRLGSLRLTDISPLHIESLVTSRLEVDHLKKPFATWSACCKGYSHLRVDDDLILRSPVRERHKPQVTRQEKPVWLKSIVESALDQHRSLFQCAMLTGARLGELLGLQWKHVDFDDQKLEIRQALWEGQLLPPKQQAASGPSTSSPDFQWPLRSKSGTRCLQHRSISFSASRTAIRSIRT